MMKTKLVASAINFFVQLGLSSDRTFFGGLMNGLLSGLPRSLVALTFNGVTDKKSGSILIYLNKDTVLYRKRWCWLNCKALIKLRENTEWSLGN